MSKKILKDKVTYQKEIFPLPCWHNLVLHFHIPSRQSLLTDPSAAAESLIEVKRERERERKKDET